MEYRKRRGTAGIGGQLYESKLLALILFNLQRDESVEYFHLATNMDDVGNFDDICLFLKIFEHDRPIALFAQLKHKESDKVIIRTENKDKVKYIESFRKVKHKVNNFFKGSVSETDFILILYTNAKFDITDSESKLESNYATSLNRLLATSDVVGCRAQRTDELVADFGQHFLEDDIELLVQHFLKILFDKENTTLLENMNDRYIQQYHVVMKSKVVDISSIQTDKNNDSLKFRTLTFQEDFFSDDDKHILLFRDHLLKKILKNYRKRLPVEVTTPEPSIDDIISGFLSDPSAATLTPLIVSHIECNEDGKLQFTFKRPPSDIEKLNHINIPRKEIENAMFAAKAAVIKYLQSVKLKVPISFGNIDLTIRGNDEKVERRLSHLSTVICDLCKEYEQTGPYKIVIIDDRIGDKVLSHNGGLASAVGNILTYDEQTKMLKFSNELTSEQAIAKRFFNMLVKEIDNLFQYRFVVKTNKFPKLHFDCADTAREFLSKLVIYEKQSNHYDVGKILKEHIKDRLSVDRHDFVMKSSQSVESVFLHYHDEVLKWWMSPKGTSLTKTNDLYQQAIATLEVEPQPQMSTLHTMFYMNNIQYFSCGFSEVATKAMDFQGIPSKLFITSDTVVLTTVKVIQCFKKIFSNNKYSVLNFENVLKLPSASFSSLCEEVRKTQYILIIILPDLQHYSDPDERLSRFALASTDKQFVVIINSELKEEKHSELKEKIMNIFLITDDDFRHETESLSNIEPQREITEAAKVLLHGQKIKLRTILDATSFALVKGAALDRVIRGEAINIGAPLSNAGYEALKDLYIDRTLIQIDNLDDYGSDHEILFLKWYEDDDTVFASRFSPLVRTYVDNEWNAKGILVRTFLDVEKEVVLLSAPPGMGKTTLLTHLALNTQREDKNLWILRVNFIDHSKQFHEWYDDDISIDVLESLKFLCQITLNNDSISFDVDIASDGDARLVNCTGDDLASFQLNMFLHYYNEGRVVYVLDGFDEICPHYKEKVIDFLTVAETRLRKKKMWVTSRPYSDILPDLKQLLGTSFKLKYLSFTEQEAYLREFWQQKLLCRKLNEQQLTNLENFMANTRKLILDNWIHRIYNIFVDVVKPLSRQKDDDIDVQYKNTRKMTLMEQFKKLSGIPLLLYFIADYFVNITNTKARNNCAFDLNLHNIYEMFIENKVRTVMFEGKIKIDPCNPITRGILDKELFDCINIHKKLAVCNFYKRLSDEPLELEELKYINPMSEKKLCKELAKIKTGKNKTGLISHVTADNTSVFIHRSFEEYFISEYICDILKSDKYDLSYKNLLYYAVLKLSNRGVADWIHLKMKTDVPLSDTFKEMKRVLPMYNSFYNDYFRMANMSSTQHVRLMASSVHDYEDGCFRFSEVITKQYWHVVNEDVRRALAEFILSYLTSGMKPYLKQHFQGPARFLHKDYAQYFERQYWLDRPMSVSLRLIIRMVGHKRSVPFFIYFSDKDEGATSHTLDTRVVSGEHIQGTDIELILFSSVSSINQSFKLKYKCTEELKHLLTSTNTTECRLRYSEKQIQEFEDKILEIEVADLVLELMRDLHSKHHRLHWYHVILKELVFDVSDVDTDDSRWSVSFRDHFFVSDDERVAAIRRALLSQILNVYISEELLDELLQQLISLFLSEPSVSTLTPLLGTYVISCEENQLTFLVERPIDDVERLRQINFPQSTIEQALLNVRAAAIEYLRSIKLLVPNSFGYDDFYTDSDLERLEIDIDRFLDDIMELCEHSEPSHVVIVDDTTVSYFSSYECLSRCVGNVLIYDEETKMLKFSQQYTSDQENAVRLFNILYNKIDNLMQYRFDIKTEKLPKLRLQTYYSSREFLSRLVICAEQDNQYELGEILLDINDWEPARKPKLTSDFTIHYALVSVHCYSELLKWWMSQNKDEHINNPSILYQRAVNDIQTERMLCKRSANFYLCNITYFAHNFTTNSLNSMKLSPSPLKLFVVSETVTLTSVKVMQWLKNKHLTNPYTILGLGQTDNCTTDSFDSTLHRELKKTQKQVIIVFSQNCIKKKILLELLRITEEKSLIIIANKSFLKCAQSCFLNTDFVFKHEIESLSTIQSQEEITRDRKVTVQGETVSLDDIPDEESR